MDEIEIVAILDRSAGNDTVGEMWQVTKVFPITSSLQDVMKWASTEHGDSQSQIECFRGNLRLTIKQ